MPRKNPATNHEPSLRRFSPATYAHSAPKSIPTMIQNPTHIVGVQSVVHIFRLLSYAVIFAVRKDFRASSSSSSTMWV